MSTPDAIIDEPRVIIKYVPASVRHYVHKRKTLAQMDRVLWTVRDGVLWITTSHWLLACEPAATIVCGGEPSDWAFYALDRPTPPAVEKGETERFGKDTITRIGQAWVSANLIAMVEDVHDAVQWHGEGPLDGVYATRDGKPVAVVMPMRREMLEKEAKEKKR